MTEEELKLRREAYKNYGKKPFNPHISLRDRWMRYVRSWSEYFIYQKNK